MSLGFYKVNVKEVRKETEDCVSLLFSIPEEMRSAFAFSPGQHIIIKSRAEDGEELRRNYSICSCPHESELRVAVKKIPGGYYSSYVNEKLIAGHELEISNPQGNFFVNIDPSHKKTYVAVAAGSGITPVMAMLKTILREEPESRFWLIYGNRDKSSIIFKQELEDLKNQYMERFSLYHVLSRESMENALSSGRIDPEKINVFLSKIIGAESVDEVYLCGPEGLIQSCRQAFEAAGIPAKRIHYELFYHQPTTSLMSKKETSGIKGETLISQVKVKLDGVTHAFALAYNGDSILEAALKQGADLPFSCKGGVCATCKCKLEQGEVHMDVNYALEPEELEQGFILSCQSHPISPNVVVNYDIK